MCKNLIRLTEGERVVVREGGVVGLRRGGVPGNEGGVLWLAGGATMAGGRVVVGGRGGVRIAALPCDALPVFGCLEIQFSSLPTVTLPRPVAIQSRFGREEAGGGARGVVVTLILKGRITGASNPVSRSSQGKVTDQGLTQTEVMKALLLCLSLELSNIDVILFFLLPFLPRRGSLAMAHAFPDMIVRGTFCYDV